MTNAKRIDVTVTYLEMTMRPTRPLRPPPIIDQSVILIKSEKPVVSFYRHIYAEVGLPWLWFERCEMNDGELDSIIRDDNVSIYILYVGSIPAGFAELDSRKPPNDRKLELHLTYFGLVTEFIGRGLGRYFLDAIIDIAWTRDIDRLWLRTCSLDHPAALPIYQKAGFEAYRKERYLIQDPRSRGIIPTVDNPASA